MTLCMIFATGCAVAPLQSLSLSQSTVTSVQPDPNSGTESALTEEDLLLLPYRGRGHGKWGRRGKHGPHFGFIQGAVAATVVMVLLFSKRSHY